LGVFHADPHPGNLLKLDDPEKGKVALLDFGLVATLSQVKHWPWGYVSCVLWAS
jgi:predicted unusual protein kinase regulating ubiquinone biosynthesis (AarF/ABC1/UbiB family)